MANNGRSIMLKVHFALIATCILVMLLAYWVNDSFSLIAAGFFAVINCFGVAWNIKTSAKKFSAIGIILLLLFLPTAYAETYSSMESGVKVPSSCKNYCDRSPSTCFYALNSTYISATNGNFCICPARTSYRVINSVPQCVSIDAVVISGPINQPAVPSTVPAAVPQSSYGTAQVGTFPFNDWKCINKLGNNYCARINYRARSIWVGKGALQRQAKLLTSVEYEVLSGNCLPTKCSTTKTKTAWLFGQEAASNCLLAIKTVPNKEEYKFCGKETIAKALPIIVTGIGFATMGTLVANMYLQATRA